MPDVNSIEPWRRFEIPGRVSMLEGNGELPKIELKSDSACAEIYLHGAHVTDFQQNGSPPLLFLSQFSRFTRTQPIRGGVPIIFPWFGPGDPMHGFARLANWHLHEAVALPAGGATLRFSMPDVEAAAMYPPFTAYYVVTLTDHLTLELFITNSSPDQPLTCENCLHTYFHVGDISSVKIRGLAGVSYLDKVEGYAHKTEANPEIRIDSEIDRIYLDTPGPIEILDQSFGRKILVEKSGSKSTVVWNPWVTKAQQMPDFGNEEYKHMVCVESGNVADNRLTLAPGQTSVLKVTLSATSL